MLSLKKLWLKLLPLNAVTSLSWVEHKRSTPPPLPLAQLRLRRVRRTVRTNRIRQALLTILVVALLALTVVFNTQLSAQPLTIPLNKWSEPTVGVERITSCVARVSSEWRVEERSPSGIVSSYYLARTPDEVVTTDGHPVAMRDARVSYGTPEPLVGMYLPVIRPLAREAVKDATRVVSHYYVFEVEAYTDRGIVSVYPSTYTSCVAKSQYKRVKGDPARVDLKMYTKKRIEIRTTSLPKQ